MRRYIFVPLESFPIGASFQQRDRHLFLHCQKMQKMNPQFILPYGVKKRWWHFGKIEHPFTVYRPRADISTMKRGEWLTDGEEDYSVYADAVICNGVPTVETTCSGDCVKFFKQGDPVWKTTPEWLLRARERKRLTSQSS